SWQEACGYRHAAIKQVAEGRPWPGGHWWEYAALQGLSETQQGGGSGFVGYPENADLCRRGGHKHSLATHQRGCQGWIDRGDRYLFPADELGRSRQLVFIADRARVATKEVEVDKDRVVRTVRLHVQGQQGEGPQGEGRAGRQVGIPDVSQDLSGDRL